LPDWWELEYFGSTGVDPYGNPAGDGWNNYEKFLNGMNPTNFYSPPAPQNLTLQTPAMGAGLADHVWSIVELLTYSGQVGSEKWFCPLHEPTVSPPIQILKAA
jgi:hypothetical protein